MAASVACPLCLHSSFSQINDLVSAFLGFFQRPLNCPFCNHLVDSALTLKEHLIEHLTQRHETPGIVGAKVIQERDRYVCKQCNCFHTNDVTALKLHVESEHPERKFLCLHCCKQFKEAQASLTLHLRMAHQVGCSTNRKHQCQFCTKKFASVGRKQAHEKVHLSELSPGPVKSPCDTRTTDLVEASNEVEEPKTLYACPVCDKTFKKEQYLQQHSRTHEAKKWECSVCRKLFTTKEYLRKHSRLHTGETPYTCDQCGKTFTFQQSYHKHLLYHSDERPYSCDQCNRRFKELSTLHNHQRIHTGEKPYSCDTCGKAFRQRVSYVVHRRIHTGALPYVCPACGKSFRYKVSQRTHKCDATASEDTNDIVRHRPDWLERLVTAQQISEDPIEDSIITIPNDSPAVEVKGESSESSTNVDSNSHTILIDSKSMMNYDNDPLPTLDLSQLTLSLDSDLIFPSQYL